MTSKFKKWILFEHDDNSLFFTHLRRTCYVFHCFFIGHTWRIEKNRPGIRICENCGDEEWQTINRKTGKIIWINKFPRYNDLP